ncbi:MAG: nitroreductase [Dehalococcoidia bacterium]|jgi:nitroreductase
MEVSEAIKQRKSVRAFKPDPVPEDILYNIIEQALRAPSWANTQPWEFMVVSGQPLKEIQDGFVARGMQDPQSEVDRPYEFPEPYMARIRALAPRDRKEMTRDEMEERTLLNFRHYGATTCIYLLVGKSILRQSKGINVWSMYDSGSAVQNLMLLATDRGLGTIAQAQAVVYPDIIRKVVKVPETKLIALGIAIGYPDWDDPVTERRTEREPMDKVVTWYGFD